jgi:hypothetical protein
MHLDKKDRSRGQMQFLAAWYMVCKPKKHDGLGVINLKIQNEALLMKFLRKFYPLGPNDLG